MMTTNKLTKTFASGVATLGIAAVSSVAGSLLVAPSASAACYTGGISFGTVQCGDKKFTFEDASVGFPPGTLEIDYDLAGDTYDFNYDFTPDYAGASSFVKYKVEITDPNSVFKTVKLDPMTSGMMEEATKLVEWNGGSHLLTSTGGSMDMFNFPDHVKSITVTDTLNPNGGTIKGVLNSFTQTKVPEPGTILGLLAVGGLGMVSRFKKQK